MCARVPVRVRVRVLFLNIPLPPMMLVLGPNAQRMPMLSSVDQRAFKMWHHGPEKEIRPNCLFSHHCIRPPGTHPHRHTHCLAGGDRTSLARLGAKHSQNKARTQPQHSQNTARTERKHSQDTDKTHKTQQKHSQTQPKHSQSTATTALQQERQRHRGSAVVSLVVVVARSWSSCGRCAATTVSQRELSCEQALTTLQ